MFKRQVPPLYLWCDKDCGIGHIMRCQTLGNEWLRRGGRAYFNGEPTAPAVIVFDNYSRDDSGCALWQCANLTVVIEDRPLADLVTCDVLLNPNYGAEKLRYNTTGKTLLGAQYFMLRDEYRTLNVNDMLEVFDADAQGGKMEQGQFALLMASAKVIVCAASSVAHEALYLKKPMLLRITAENQRIPYDALLASGYALPENSDSERRARLDKAYLSKVKGQNIIDGKGVERVVDVILDEWEKKVWSGND